MPPRRSYLVLAAIALCAVLFGAAATAIGADSGLIAFQGNVRDVQTGKVEKGIYTMTPEGKGVKRLGDGFEPAISRDGKEIVFANVAGPVESNQVPDVEIFTMDADGGNLRQITHDESTDTEPAFSADGKRIVFVGDRHVKGASGEFPHIFVVDTDGSNERQLTKGSSSDLEPAFSPDGRRIVFVRGPGESRLMTMSAEGEDLVTLTNPRDPFSIPDAPSYSPDGKRILFHAPEDRANRIFTLDAADGKDLKLLTRGEDQGFEPAYSPDGETIVFRRGINLFTMAADGTRVQQISDRAPNQGSNVHPSWGR